MNILAFAKQILEIPSPSGYTKNVINFLKKHCEKEGFQHHLTQKGNLIIQFPGLDQYRLGLSA
nr:aminopeptidase [Bacilli bacterium]